LNLEDRIVSVDSLLLEISNIDYTIPLERLAEERNHSVDYLKKALIDG
jgi:hypothetical protein